MDNIDKQIPGVSSATNEQLLEIVSSFTKSMKTVGMILKIFVFPRLNFF